MTDDPKELKFAEYPERTYVGENTTVADVMRALDALAAELAERTREVIEISKEAGVQKTAADAAEARAAKLCEFLDVFLDHVRSKPGGCSACDWLFANAEALLRGEEGAK